MIGHMRNQPKPLDEFDAARQRKIADSLAVGDKVALTYTKRNGAESSSRGEVAFFNGHIGYDTGSVTVLDPDKGMRTINIHRIIEVRHD